MTKMRTLFVLVLLAVTVCVGYLLYNKRPVPDYGRSVLVFTKTSEFRHASIPTGIEALRNLGHQQQFNITATEDAEVFTDASLAQYSAVVFMNTTGDVLDTDQQIALERYIQAGGGFLGIHAAADTEWAEGDWYWYQRLVGGVFAGHPENSSQKARVIMQGAHASVVKLPPSWDVVDEWYDFKRLSRGTNVIMTVDEATYEGGKMGEDHPVAWFREFDGGRSFYIALGHGEDVYSNPGFIDLVAGGLEYAMGTQVTLDYSRSRPEPWRFQRRILASGLNEPLKIAFSPEGDLYFVERPGFLQRYDFETGEVIEVARLKVDSNFEYGLLGLAFDPHYASNRWIYLYRTVQAEARSTHVLSRFELVDDALRLETEQRLLEIPADAKGKRKTAHTGGDIQFDGAGNLWLSTGDDTAADDYAYVDDRPGKENFDAARSAGNTQDLRGKILRITPTDAGGYTVPAGNLFKDEAEGRPEIYAMGMRNPYTIAYDDRTGYLYWGDIGPDGKADSDRGPRGYDEVNRTNAPGNFGWPYAVASQAYAYFDYEQEKVLDKVQLASPENRSRNNTGQRFLAAAQPAWLYYPYDESEEFWELGSGGRNALVAPVYYEDNYAASDIKFPRYLQGKLIISDFIRRWLKVVSVDGRGEIETITPLISSSLSAPLDMAFGPDGALYIVEYGSSWFQANPDSHISRIEFYSSDNPPPVPIIKGTRTIGAAPFESRFDASDSYDLGESAGSLQYQWLLHSESGPVVPLGVDATQTVAITSPGLYRLELLLTDSEGAESRTVRDLQVGNDPAQVTLQLSGNRSFFFDDRPLDYSVSVADLEDGSTDNGTIAASAVRVLVDYIGQGSDLARALAAATDDPLRSGEELATQGSDCHSCHKVEEGSVGPAFREIARRYGQQADAHAYLKRVILEGVSGQWEGGHSMPAHPALEDSQLASLADYILSLASTRSPRGGWTSADPSDNLKGRIVFDKHQKDYVDAVLDNIVKIDLGRFFPGSYILHAAYTDQAVGGVPSTHASDTVRLRHPRVGVSDFDLLQGPMIFPVNEVVNLAAFPHPDQDIPFPHVVLREIDLTGITGIELSMGAMKPIFGGGLVELRLDDPTAESVAGTQIEATFGVDEDSFRHVLDVSGIQGVHDLYLGFSESDGGGRGAGLLVSLEFLYGESGQ